MRHTFYLYKISWRRIEYYFSYTLTCGEQLMRKCFIFPRQCWGRITSSKQVECLNGLFCNRAMYLRYEVHATAGTSTAPAPVLSKGTLRENSEHKKCSNEGPLHAPAKEVNLECF